MSRCWKLVTECLTVPLRFLAYLGLTPQQYSSGRKVNLVGISKHAANRRLQAVLIQGAKACVHKLKAPRSPRDRWMWADFEALESIVPKRCRGAARIGCASALLQQQKKVVVTVR